MPNHDYLFMTFNVSLLISSYNWKDALQLALKCALNQTVLPKEILIADDGSREDTHSKIKEIQKVSPIPIIHVWQEDKGFRVSKIRNKAIACATGDYIIQIDGDILINRHFIADHLELAKEGCFVCGSRVLLSPKTTDSLIRGDKEPFNLFVLSLNGMRLRFLRHLLADRYDRDYMHSRGCNMAFWRKNVIAINGYDESFEAWGYEDSELAYRLIASGVQKRFLKMGGVAFHMHHSKVSRDGEVERMKALQQSVASGRKWTVDGLDKYLQSPEINILLD